MPISAQEVCEFRGKIVDEKGEPIPYSSIYFSKISKGGMANAEGNFSVKVPCGNYEVLFQSLGYQSVKMQFSIHAGSENSKIILAPTSYQLMEVQIDPSSEDPAYNIIRKATVMAEYYKNQITAFDAKLYIRSYYKVDEIPWIAKKLAPKEDLQDMQAGNISETILNYSYEKPNKVKEEILARKTGDHDTSKTGSNFINMSFYNLGGTSIINPLQRGAFQVYRFEHQSSYLDGEQKVHKIEIIPKRKGNDLMRGYIFINDALWNINSVDVEFDVLEGNIHYTQFYKAVEPLVWMPINHKILVDFDMLGFNGEVQYLATLSDLSVQTDDLTTKKIKQNLQLEPFEPSKKDSLILPNPKKQKKLSKTQEQIEELIQKDKLSNRETFKLVRLAKKEAELQKEKDSTESIQIIANRNISFVDSAFSNNDSLWNAERDVPLSSTESTIYVARDSMNKVERGDTIITKKRSLMGKILFYDGGIQSKNKQHTFRPKGIFSGITGYFNTVDGFTIYKRLFDYEWDNKKGKFYSIRPSIAYAFSREKVLGQIDFESQYNLMKGAGFNVSVGRKSTDFNQYQAMPHLLNSFASLVFTENFPKFYQEDFVSIEHHFDAVDGLEISTAFHYSDRKALVNNSSYKLFDFRSKTFSDNLPNHLEIQENPNIINNNKSAQFELKLSYTPNQKYYIYKNRKRKINSLKPTYTANFFQGIPDFAGSNADFSRFSLSIHQVFPFRLINRIAYHLEAGRFLSKKQVAFADFKNFATAPFYVQSNTGKASFNLLNYYRYNTNDAYLQAHLSIEDNHLFLKYLPLLNNTNLTEKLHFNYLTNDQVDHYYEVGYSLNRIFLLLNIGIYSAFEGDDFDSIGFRIGLNLDN